MYADVCVYTMRYKYKNIIYYKYYIHMYVENLARVPEGRYDNVGEVAPDLAGEIRGVLEVVYQA